MNKQLIEFSKYLFQNGAGIFNVNYLQKSENEHNEKSMLGQRERMLEFHRFVYSLDDESILKAFKTLREYRSSSINSKENYVDQSLMFDVLQYHILIRDEAQRDSLIAKEIADSYFYNIKLLDEVDKQKQINSKHMINFLEMLLAGKQ